MLDWVMDDASPVPDAPPRPGGAGGLRRGWTTGACAAAATRAAFHAILTGRFPDPVRITLPGGQTPAFALARESLSADRRQAGAGIIKDAGDDPDVTHGALVQVRLDWKPQATNTLTYAAGEGVGTVRLPGLPLAVGEPAINPVPRAMIRKEVDALRDEHGVRGALVVTVSIPGGEALAARTMNGRLGIEGGLSILGTTGIVVPYSCASWIHAIHRGVDVARALGLPHLAAATGSTSEAAARERLDLQEQAWIDMGDFAGGLLKYLRDHPVERLTLAGGFAKLAKLAAGELDLHSARSRLDHDDLAAMAGDLGADAALKEAIRAAPSGGAALALCRQAGLPIADRVARRARETARATLGNGIAVDVLVFDRKGDLIGSSDG